MNDRDQNQFPYQKYLQSGQVAYVRVPLEGGNDENSLSAVIDRCSESALELSLAYDEEALDGYDFTVGNPVKISSEVFGTGIVGSGVILAQPRLRKLWVQLVGHLELSYQREHQRIDLATQFAFIPKYEALDTIVAEWQEIAGNPEIARERYPMKQGKINVGAGGFGVTIESQVKVNDFVFFLFELEGESSPVVALAEVVWVDLDKMFSGQRFVILDQKDQKRIERMVWRATKKEAE